MVEGIDSKPKRGFLPKLADELVGSKSSKSFELHGEVVGHQERLEMFFELLMGLIVVAFDGSLFKGSVHALDLTVRPGMLWFGAAVLDFVLFTGIGKCMNSEKEWRNWFALFLYPCWFECVVHKVRAVIDAHGVNGVRNGSDQNPQKLAEIRRVARSCSSAKANA